MRRALLPLQCGVRVTTHIPASGQVAGSMQKQLALLCRPQRWLACEWHMLRLSKSEVSSIAVPGVGVFLLQV